MGNGFKDGAQNQCNVVWPDFWGVLREIHRNLMTMAKMSGTTTYFPLERRRYRRTWLQCELIKEWLLQLAINTRRRMMHCWLLRIIFEQEFCSHKLQANCPNDALLMVTPLSNLWDEQFLGGFLYFFFSYQCTYTMHGANATHLLILIRYPF